MRVKERFRGRRGKGLQLLPQRLAKEPRSASLGGSGRESLAGVCGRETATGDGLVPNGLERERARKTGRTYNSFSIPHCPGSGSGAQQPPRIPRAARRAKQPSTALPRAAGARLMAAGGRRWACC